MSVFYPVSVSNSHRMDEFGSASGKHLVQSMLRAGSATVGFSEPCPVRF